MTKVHRSGHSLARMHGSFGSRGFGALLATLIGCSSTSGPAPVPASGPALVAERGFLPLDAQTLASASGHMFYVFFPADLDAPSKPLFVFFNGGPGAATTIRLLAEGTAPKLVDPTGAVRADPASFTPSANLLYLDSRLAGLSYDDAPAENEGFDMSEDAIDFVRSIVRFLDGHPALRAAPIVLVGESYGGTRAQLILDDVLQYASRTTAPLHGLLQDHFDAVFPETAGGAHGPREVARQFVAQALIQPLVGGAYQNEASTPQGDGCYDTRVAASDPQCVDTADSALAALSDPARSTAWLGGALEDVSGLRPPERHGFRLVGDPALESVQDVNDANAQLTTRLGMLDASDAYFGDGLSSSAFNGDADLVPPAFVRNLRYVHTFITRAAFDGAIDSSAIPVFLTKDANAPTVFDGASPPGAARPGTLAVSPPASSEGPAVQVNIRFPEYQAGHSVTQTAAMPFHDDVIAFLQGLGIVK
jgi:Serine carboxypeptidase